MPTTTTHLVVLIIHSTLAPIVTVSFLAGNKTLVRYGKTKKEQQQQYQQQQQQTNKHKHLKRL